MVREDLLRGGIVWYSYPPIIAPYFWDLTYTMFRL